MNAENHEFDPKLEALFAREHAHLPAEPFSSATLRRLAAERARAALLRRVLRFAGFVALIVASPQLIAASIWLSARLDDVFAVVSSWLSSPYGMVVAVLAALAGFMVRRPLAATATKWARVWSGF